MSDDYYLSWKEVADLCNVTGLKLQVGVHVELLAEEVPPFTGRGTYTFTYVTASICKRAIKFGKPYFEATFRVLDFIGKPNEALTISAARVFYMGREQIMRLPNSVDVVVTPGSDLTVEIRDEDVPWPLNRLQ